MFSEILLLTGIALAVASVMMVIIWLIALKIKNFGIVDIAWSYGFSLIVLAFLAVGSGTWSRKGLIAGMVTLWSLRLGTYLYIRVMGHHPVEDGRYQMLREEWGTNTNRKMFWFFQFQAILLVILSAPFLLATINHRPDLSFFEWAGLALWATGLIGESLADQQLARFKANPANKGRVCQVGLWYYSRHPNYFFEWLIWVAYFVFALGSPWGWVSLYCPAMMFYFLFRVTGIPMTEVQAVRTKGEEYREYQRTTSAFVPWFRKTA